jgi:hypothetical protein
MLRRLVMDGHNSLSSTSLSLQYRFVNILYICTLFLLLNTFCHELTGIVTLCNELLYNISFDMYTVTKRFFDATNTISQFSRSFHMVSIFTVEHILTRMVTSNNALYLF